MTDTTKETVTLAIDIKKYRIRVHKKMLHLLGDPKYVQLLVNPNNKYVAVKGIEKPTLGDQSEKIKSQNMLPDNSYELYSKSFVEKLCDVAEITETNCTYRLTGTIVESHNMAIFSLKTLKRLEN